MARRLKLDMVYAAAHSAVEEVHSPENTLAKALQKVPAGQSLLVVRWQGRPDLEEQVVFGPDDAEMEALVKWYATALGTRGLHVYHVTNEAVQVLPDRN